MATAPFNPNENVPADDDIVSQFPAAERAFRDIIEDWINFEHDSSGHHKIMVDTEANRDAVTDWVVGSLMYNTDEEELQILTDDDPVTWASASVGVEEGTWTPTLAFGGSTTGITYSTQVGTYRRVGNYVKVFGRIVLTSNGTGFGDATIGGLPATPATRTGMKWVGSLFLEENIFGLDEFATNAVAVINSGASSISLHAYDGADDSHFDLGSPLFDDSAEFSFSIEYEVAA